MSKKCSNQRCQYVNSDSSHYCVKCGKPLEKLYIFSSRPDKTYEVIAKSELDSLKNERNRLRKQINESYALKIESWVKVNKETIFWTSITFIAIVIGGWLFTKCDFTHNKQVIEIKKNDVTGKYGIFDNKTETLVTPFEYDSISHRKSIDKNQNVYRNYFYLFKNGKIGVADGTGKTTINCSIDATDGAYNGIVILQKGEKKGIMDLFGHRIIPCEYQYVLWKDKPKYNSFETPGSYVGNIIPVAVNKNSYWELYNRNGVKISNQRYKEAIQTGNPKLIKVREVRNDYRVLYGIVDENGQVIVPCKYYSISVFEEDRAWVKEKYSDPWSLITSNGERLMTLPFKYTPSAFHDGMAAIKNNGKIGYCDINGKFVIPMNYEQINNNDGSYISFDFYYGKAKVLYKGKPGYLDKKGIFTPDNDKK